MDEKYIARFWSKVDKRDPDDCWEWQTGSGSRARSYGAFYITANGEQVYGCIWHAVRGRNWRN